MPGPYSDDLRERVIAALEVGEQSQAKIAETFGVHLSTAEKWWRCWRQSQRRVALPHSGGHTRRLEVCDTVIRAAVKRQPDITLAELIDQVETECAVRASSSMMSRELQRLALRRKKRVSTTVSGKRRG
jgi:transposase